MVALYKVHLGEDGPCQVSGQVLDERDWVPVGASGAVQLPEFATWASPPSALVEGEGSWAVRAAHNAEAFHG